ncbi:histidine kinase [Rhodoferax saidenbachensis]|uniref:Two-component sensor histidine kinase n=1 Tax=Rhodoferax saidenbachensis TaxID=1484693 RepID=A0ABU1ZQ55_9BURK|nr:histidine kinase [Rhodoferax saidenbachensis]MDR7307665.1 two-component sensor histidine kinase [Rhodoferax saidenbachensis]
MRLDWINKLQHLLQTWAFSLAVATLQYAFQPEKPYVPLMAYSLAIGTFIWAIIDLGRHLFPSADETGWPLGAPGFLLMGGGIVAGYFLGNLLADTLCRTFGWYAGYPVPDGAGNLRNKILITFTAGVAGTYYFYTLNNSAYLERKMTEARHLAAEARLKLLETQLDPHMLFNTLANLRALIGVDPVRAQTMLDHMIAYLRATLSASRASGQDGQHTLADEFARLQDYLELMKIRMGPRLQFTLDLPEALRTQPVPPLLLQPLVENSIQHGLEPKVEGGSIAIRAAQEGGLLCLEVTDTGMGAPEVLQSRPGHGFGLQQVRDRLLTTFDTLGTMKLIAVPTGGTRVRITFPIQA